MSKKDSEATADILSYLKSQNRPYSAVDVFNNLHKKHGKTVVTRCLEQLAAAEKIKEKTYGKQKVYVIDQSQFEAVDDNELKKLDGMVVSLTKEGRQLEEECRVQEHELKALSTVLTTEEAESQLKQITSECDLMSNAQNITPEEKDKICKDHLAAVKEWRKRKRMVMDVVNSIMEGYPKSKKHLYEEVGIETDEDCGVVMAKD
ncbi:homologous-pairing protein 2 homolog [Corticium candelabrum]|uniref:homologous-pairing protein 2 homolog n=1 Tax=Corticium candelabrum TaxID=121492 RepID=UPI002E255656|nr:homologous-pairing protein 2 homolog [Corticium candelabrum]